MTFEYATMIGHKVGVDGLTKQKTADIDDMTKYALESKSTEIMAGSIDSSGQLRNFIDTSNLKK